MMLSVRNKLKESCLYHQLSHFNNVPQENPTEFGMKL